MFCTVYAWSLSVRPFINSLPATCRAQLSLLCPNMSESHGITQEHEINMFALLGLKRSLVNVLMCLHMTNWLFQCGNEREIYLNMILLRHISWLIFQEGKKRHGGKAIAAWSPHYSHTVLADQNIFSTQRPTDGQRENDGRTICSYLPKQL